MTSPSSLEPKGTIDTGLPWKTVAKGSRSSTRRTKKQVAQAAAPDIEAVNKSSAAGGDSESDKRGASVLGQHLAERIEHVPLKKRRFMAPTPSPPDSSFARGEGTQHRVEVNQTLPVSTLNPNLMGGKTAQVSDVKPDWSTQDLSGIKILVDAACSSGIASVVDSQSVDPVQKQDAFTLSAHTEGNDLSTGTVDDPEKDSMIKSRDKARVGKGESETVVPHKGNAFGNTSVADQSGEHSLVVSTGMVGTQNISITVSNESSTERPKEIMEVGDNGNLAPQSKSATASENFSSDDHTGKGKNTECLTDDRFHWDLNLPTDEWGQPCDATDEVSRQYSDGGITESGIESRRVDGSEEYATCLIASDVQVISTAPSGPKAEAPAQNGKECQSGYDSQFEDGELREPYPWEENEGDCEDVEQVDYGSEPESERFYSLAETNENNLEDAEKGVLAETKCGAVKCESGNVLEGSSDIEKHIVVCTSDSRSKGSSPSRSFRSRPFRELPSHETIRRRRSNSYKEMKEGYAGPNNFVGRERSGMRMRSRSPRKGQFGGWDSRRRFSPPKYEGGQHGFRQSRSRTLVEDRVMMEGFDQPRAADPGPGSQGYVRRQFPNGGYRGQFRRFPDGDGNRDFRWFPDGSGNRDFRRFPDGGGNRDFRGVVDRPSFPPGDANDYPSRMHNSQMNSRRERSNSPPVFRRLHDPQSRSRSRSRSPVLWNRPNRSPPRFRADDDDKIERVRLPFQKQFRVDQERVRLPPPRNQRNSRFFDGRNNDGAGENHHNNFRRRNSPPGRIVRPEQRFDNMRRVNPDNNNFRPFLRHDNKRFGDGGRSRGGRGCKYEGGEDQEKNRNRYEMVHRPYPPRRLEAAEEDSDSIRRFRLNPEQQQFVVSDNNQAS